MGPCVYDPTGSRAEICSDRRLFSTPSSLPFELRPSGGLGYLR